jgi:death-on-curing protein
VTKYLSVMDVLAMNQELLDAAGQEPYLMHENALEAAVMRPQMHAHYGQADLIEQAAALIVGVALAHAFLDGNKRTALVSGIAFLKMNGLGVRRRPLELAEQIEAVINRNDSLDDATARFVEWLRPRIVPFS